MKCNVPVGIIDLYNIGQTCENVFASCITQGPSAIKCSNSSFAPTFAAPYCTALKQSAGAGSLGVLGTGIVPYSIFECGGLIVECWLLSDIFEAFSGTAVDPTLIYCNSLPGSNVWKMGANRDASFQMPSTSTGIYTTIVLGLVDVGIPGLNQTGVKQTLPLSGCLLDPASFVADASNRCTYLAQQCSHTCINGQTDVGLTFCDSTDTLITTFACDTQGITCTVNGAGQSPTLTLADMTQFAANPDLDRQHRTVQCVTSTAALQSGSGLRMNCLADQFLLLASNNVCSALLTQCALNHGSITCVSPYAASSEEPFCTQEAGSPNASPLCDCGVWWSQTEGNNILPAAMFDAFCHDNYPNTQLAECNAAVTLDLTLTASSQIPNYLAETNFPFISGNTLPAGIGYSQDLNLGLTCERRGYISMENYLRRNLTFTAYNLYKVNNWGPTGMPWMRYW